jgi:hypothetical protein
MDPESSLDTKRDLTDRHASADLQLEKVLHLHEELAVIELPVRERLFFLRHESAAVLAKVVVCLDIVGRAYIEERERSQLIRNQRVKHPRITEIVVLREQPQG